MRVSGPQQQVQMSIIIMIMTIIIIIYCTLDKPELRTVLRELIKVDSKWENIGIFLEVDPHRLESIKTTEHHDTQNCLREMLKIWLKKINPPPSWSAIINVLECLGEEQLAHDLRSKYLH